jgi:ABC-type sugar transport system ATPase subunit
MAVQVAEDELKSVFPAGEERPILEMVGVTKRFPGVLALDKVNFSVRRGEIHSLIGQNGAGKSTLMHVLSGIYPANEGQIFIDGQPVTITHPREALRLGIGTVYQELSLLPRLSVADNIFLGREPGNGFIINEAAVLKRAAEVLAQLGVKNVDVKARVGELPLAQQQLVEIAKVLSHQPRILVLDEPTASLAEEETVHLFDILKGLKAHGIAIIFISHRFKEIIQHCDRGTILRNGKLVKTVELSGVTENELAEIMIGQQVESFFRHDGQGEPKAGDQVLEVSHLSVGQKVKDVSFALRRGEILGITGLLGAGQNELVRALFGIQENVTGTIRRNGQALAIRSPSDAIQHGICLLTENRKVEGLVLDMSVKENVTLPSLSMFRRAPVFIDNAGEERATDGFVRRLNIIVRSVRSKVRTLSGGNQQKTILARWLLRNLDILVFIEPTRGIDVGAKADIYQYLDRLAKEGKSIVVVSPELLEILGVSDRILVMYNGRLTNVFDKGTADEESLLSAVQGGSQHGG